VVSSFVGGKIRRSPPGVLCDPGYCSASIRHNRLVPVSTPHMNSKSASNNEAGFGQGAVHRLHVLRIGSRGRPRSPRMQLPVRAAQKRQIDTLIAPNSTGLSLSISSSCSHNSRNRNPPAGHDPQNAQMDFSTVITSPASAHIIFMHQQGGGTASGISSPRP